MFLFAGRCALFDENTCIIMILKDYFFCSANDVLGGKAAGSLLKDYFFCSANDEINENCGKGKNDCRGNAHRDGFV